MFKLKERLLFMALGGVLTVGVLALVLWYSSRTQVASVSTRMTLINYRAAITNFFGTAGRWPTSMTELVTNSMGVTFIWARQPASDGWGRPILLESYNATNGFGRLVSYGRDGKPSGEGADADFEERFP